MELRSVILNRISPREFYTTVFPESNGTGNVMCPFHKDKNPSLQLREDGSSYCYGCRKSWKNIIEFYMTLKDVNMSIAMYHLYNQYIDKLISRKKYLDMFYQLEKKSRAYEWLINRGIGDRTIKRFLIGLDIDKGRISLPIFNEFGYCVNIKMFRYTGNEAEPKVFSYGKGYGKPRLFPLNSLFHKEVYIFEGEMDTLLALHLGLNAITSGGASSWRREFTEYFKDKIVYICYDNDEAGREGSRFLAKELSGVAERIYNIIVPKEFGKDFTDMMHQRPIEAFLDLVSATREITPEQLRDVKRMKDIEAFAQEELMIVDLKPNQRTLHVIVKLDGGEDVRTG